MRKAWLEYLFGKPSRTMKYVGALGLVVLLATPGLLATVFNRLMVELGPVLSYAIQLGIVLLVLRYMIGSVFPKKGSK